MNYYVYFYRLWVEVAVANIEFATKVAIPVMTRMS
jgi:hypothetical protein